MNCNIKFLIKSIKWHTYTVDAWLVKRLIAMCNENQLYKVKYCMSPTERWKPEYSVMLMTTSAIQPYGLPLRQTEMKIKGM